MKMNLLLKKLLCIVCVFLAAIWVVVRFPLGSWFSVLVGTLSAAFLWDALKMVSGQDGFWTFVSLRDKLVAFINLIIILIFISLPLMLDLSGWYFLAFLMLGYGLAWFVTELFGSYTVKKKIFGFQEKNAKNA